MHEIARGFSASGWVSPRKGGIRMGIGYGRLNCAPKGMISGGNATETGSMGRTMEGKRNTCAPECIKKGGRGFKVPFPNERASSGEDSTKLSGGEDEPQTLDDRVLLCAADR